jgi:hypothetical protein
MPTLTSRLTAEVLSMPRRWSRATSSIANKKSSLWVAKIYLQNTGEGAKSKSHGSRHEKNGDHFFFFDAVFLGSALAAFSAFFGFASLISLSFPSPESWSSSSSAFFSSSSSTTSSSTYYIVSVSLHPHRKIDMKHTSNTSSWSGAGSAASFLAFTVMSCLWKGIG